MNNLQNFRNQIDKFASEGIIADRDQWNELMERLCDLKLLNPQQVKILQQNSLKRNFPVTVPELQEIIMKQFGSEQNKALLNDLLTIQRQIRQTKGVLNIWKDKGLSNSQINSLRITFAKGNQKIKEICKSLQDKKQLMDSVCEQEIQLIKSMNEWIIMQKITKLYENFEQFLEINQKTIEGIFNQIKVREVHYRNKKVSKVANDDNVQIQIGFNSKNDDPVEVTKIPKKYSNFQHMNIILMTFNAHRDLLISPYFLRFKGYNNIHDHQNFLYFRQYTESANLKHIIFSSNCQLDEGVALFKYWAGQLYRAFRDLHIMCSYTPILPIKLQDFSICDHGLRLILKNIKFNAIRDVNDQTLQPKLLENLGLLILQILKIEKNNINEKIKNIENVSLIHALLKANEAYQQYKNKIIPCYINFFNVQTHPLFESIYETQGIQIINNFTVLYGDLI